MPPVCRRVPALLSAVFAAAAIACSVPAIAAPASQTGQVPGYYRQPVGQFTVTALYDGHVELSPQLLHGIKPEEIQARIARMFQTQSSKGVQTAVNGFLVRTGQDLLLIDTGAGKCLGQNLGRIPHNLEAAGYAPTDVTAVLLTHLHADHSCGLVSADGKPAFPNATVWASSEEQGYWLDPKTAQAAPENKRRSFKLAQDAVAPYASQGRLKTLGAGEVLPGLSIVASPGHTPGHTSYLLRSGDDTLLIWGDIVHSHAVQFAHPEVSIDFDSDQKQAIATRKSMLDKAASEKWMVAGAHLPFPGMGHVRKDAEAYAWVPIEYAPIDAPAGK